MDFAELAERQKLGREGDIRGNVRFRLVSIQTAFRDLRPRGTRPHPAQMLTVCHTTKRFASHSKVRHYVIMDDKLTFDPIERRAEKQAQRDADAQALARGDVTREELSRANGLFSSPAIVNRRVVRRYGKRSK